MSSFSEQMFNLRWRARRLRSVAAASPWIYWTGVIALALLATQVTAAVITSPPQSASEAAPHPAAPGGALASSPAGTSRLAITPPPGLPLRPGMSVDLYGVGADGTAHRLVADVIVVEVDDAVVVEVPADDVAQVLTATLQSTLQLVISGA